MITLKLSLKAARTSGKIYKQPENTCDSGPHLVRSAANNLGNFGNYIHPLSDEEWTQFEADERAFRKLLDTKLIDDKQRIMFSGNDPTQWNRLIALLQGLYHKNGTFSAFHKDGRPFGTSLLKYTIRMLSKLPVHSDPPKDKTPENLASWIKHQLRFTREIIQPALNRAAGAQQQRLPKKVGRESLAYLWNNNRSKAIRIILNNSIFLSPPKPRTNT